MTASPFTWADISDIRRLWTGPLLVKGIVTPEDARLALEAGADAVVVSNHGGRQLDGAPATMDVLPAVVDTVNGKGAVLLDGGVRRGSDVVKAVAAGAQAVLVGRAYLYGLAAAGEPGVGRVLEVLRSETVRTLQLLGCPSVGALDRTWIDLPGRDGLSPGAGAPEPGRPQRRCTPGAGAPSSTPDGAELAVWTCTASHSPTAMSTANRKKTTARLTIRARGRGPAGAARPRLRMRARSTGSRVGAGATVPVPRGSALHARSATAAISGTVEAALMASTQRVYS